MICKSEAKRMCTDYTKIKNYDKAIADNTQTCKKNRSKE
jgi:hypothetical protein